MIFIFCFYLIYGFSCIYFYLSVTKCGLPGTDRRVLEGRALTAANGDSVFELSP